LAVNEAIGGDFDSQAGKLVAQRARRINAFRDLPRLEALVAANRSATGSRNAGGLFAMAQLRDARRATEGITRGDVDPEFVRQLSLLVDTFIELPKGVDRTRVALTALGEDGTVNLERLKRVAEDTSAVLGMASPGRSMRRSKASTSPRRAKPSPTRCSTHSPPGCKNAWLPKA
jgi:hypothetical protein